jgi:quercetin dioxygenase-like cupin family protein
MRPAGFLVGVCTLWLRGSATAPSPLLAHPAQPTPPTPLILEKQEGERRVWRTAGPAQFILKVDPRNGGSPHLVFGTEDLEPGGRIDPHRHPASDEILFLETGIARVQLGGSAREVHGGATVFIPANTLVSVTNIGRDTISLAFIFAAPGFEDFMRAESAPSGEKIVPLSKAEDEAIMRQYAHVVIYQAP